MKNLNKLILGFCVVLLLGGCANFNRVPEIVEVPVPVHVEPPVIPEPEYVLPTLGPINMDDPIDRKIFLQAVAIDNASRENHIRKLNEALDAYRVED